MGRAGLHLYSWVLKAVTSYTVTQSPDSPVVSRSSLKGYDPTCKQKSCFTFPIFYLQLVVIIRRGRRFQAVAQNVCCVPMPSAFLSRLPPRFHAEQHLENSQTNELSLLSCRICWMSVSVASHVYQSLPKRINHEKLTDCGTLGL